MSESRPVVTTANGSVEGVWRGPSAAFYGIPFAQAPVGDLRFAAPVPALPWPGLRDASTPGATPQRRPFAPVTTIPEPSFPGNATLNANVFTPAPGDPDAKLPVLVWIHGGGFFAGSPSSPWYDGVAYNRDGVVTVSLSYRLGFDGFGWIADAPTNRGLRDMIAGLEWVRDNIAVFGGDPSRVTIAGQSAGGSAVMALLASPPAQGLFAQVIAHSAANLGSDLAQAERAGRAIAAQAGVEPTRQGWSRLTEDEILDLQTAFMAPAGPPPAGPADFVRGTLAANGVDLPFVPTVGDDVLPTPVTAAIEAGTGSAKALLAGSVAHEFTNAAEGFGEAWRREDPVQALTDGGLPPDAAEGYVRAHPDLRSTAEHCAQLVTDLTFRIPTIAWADARTGRTWVYDFRWVSPASGLAMHCLELPFTWDLLAADGVAAVAPGAPQGLADEVHAAWVRFITSGDPGWAGWDGTNAAVFGSTAKDTYASARALASSRQPG